MSALRGWSLVNPIILRIISDVFFYEMKMCPRAMLSTEEVYETADEKREKRE
jgi:hypothetical protein